MESRGVKSETKLHRDLSSSSDLQVSEETKHSRATLFFINFIQQLLAKDQNALLFVDASNGDSPTSQNGLIKIRERLDKLNSIVNQIQKEFFYYEKCRAQRLLAQIDKGLSGAKKMADQYMQETYIHLAELRREKEELKRVESFEEQTSEAETKFLSSAEESDSKPASCCFFSPSRVKQSKAKMTPMPSERSQISDEETDGSCISTVSVEEDKQLYSKLVAIQEKDIQQSRSLSKSIIQLFTDKVLTASYAVNRDVMLLLVRLYAAVSDYKEQVAEAKGLASAKQDDWEDELKNNLKRFSCETASLDWDELFTALKQLTQDLKTKLIEDSYSVQERESLLIALFPSSKKSAKRKVRIAPLQQENFLSEKSEDDKERARLDLNSPRH